ncbi:Inner membrane protein YqiK [Escherichia coli]|nr:Inner membrane protein YqiK [Escherichia coli]
MFNLPGWLFTVIALVLTLFVIGLIFARLYRRASAEQAFVRTGLGAKSGNEWRCNCYAHFSRNNSRQHEHPEAGSQSCSG